MYGMEYKLQSWTDGFFYWMCETCGVWVDENHIKSKDHQRRLGWRRHSLEQAGVPYGQQQQQQLALPPFGVPFGSWAPTAPPGLLAGTASACRLAGTATAWLGPPPPAASLGPPPPAASLGPRPPPPQPPPSLRLAELEKAISSMQKKMDADTEQIALLQTAVEDQASRIRILETNAARAIDATVVEKLDELEKRLEAVEKEVHTWWNLDNAWIPVPAAVVCNP